MEENKMEKEQASLDKERASEIQYIQEKIKERPVNKKKLIRRTIITVVLAVVFGIVACVTFAFLEPVIGEMLYPKEEPQIITFPEEEQEIKPEDMVVDDKELQIIRQENTEQLGLNEEETPEGNGEGTETDGNSETTGEHPIEENPEIVPPMPEEIATIDTLLEDFTGEVAIDYYESVYRELGILRAEAERTMVTVTSVDPNGSWINNSLKNVGVTSGVMVADNGIELLILADSANIEDAEVITVSFPNNETENATIKGIDKNTGLAVLAVPISEMSDALKRTVRYAKLGSSAGRHAVGKPVIAIGSPIGTDGSVCYGTVTSQGTTLDMLDSNYKLITTDIYGSKNASGVLMNMDGEIIGIIYTDAANTEMPNQLSAIGISELKRTIERLSNDEGMIYLGIEGTDVSNAVRSQYNMPYGAYVSGIVMGSPAMKAGIQSGDIIIKVDDTDVVSQGEFINYLMKAKVGQTLKLTIARQSQKDYQEMTMDVTLGEQK